MKATLGVLFIVSLIASHVCGEEEPLDLEKLFQDGIALAKAGKHAEALIVYEQVLAEAPDAMGVLYNAGLAAYMAGKYEDSVRHWKRLKGLDPGDWQVRSKLVQAYQAHGKRKERDREIKDLYELRRTTAVAGLKKRKFYCRDQFTVAGKKVFAFEHFELEGDRAVKLTFTVNNEKGEKEYTLSLGSYESTNQMMQDLGELEDGVRGYHLDGTYPWGHATYRFFHGEPEYDKLRALVVSIIKGEVKPMSSSRLPAKEPEEKPDEGGK